MKNLIILYLSLALYVGFATHTFAADYNFDSGPDSGDIFGKPTGYNGLITADPLSETTRRNKDAAYLPPPYGIFSGEIPTDPSSLYHDNLINSGFAPVNQDLPPAGSANVGMLPSTSLTAAQTTAPWYYEDGSIGTLVIPSINKTIKIYEGETLANMKKGIGHFTATSAWDGNIGLAGHNRGAASYFSFVKDLRIGGRMTLTTRYGSRTYEIYRKDKIDETDSSALGWSAENIITLITCVENVPELRWCVQARAR